MLISWEFIFMLNRTFLNCPERNFLCLQWIMMEFGDDNVGHLFAVPLILYLVICRWLLLWDLGSPGSWVWQGYFPVHANIAASGLQINCSASLVNTCMSEYKMDLIFAAYFREWSESGGMYFYCFIKSWLDWITFLWNGQTLK